MDTLSYPKEGEAAPLFEHNIGISSLRGVRVLEEYITLILFCAERTGTGKPEGGEQKKVATWNLIATATFGLESLLAWEIKELGYREVEVANGKVSFAADENAICRSNLWLRTADRVRVKVGEFPATTFEELFEKTRDLPWAEIIPREAEFPVEGKSVKSTLFSVSDCQAIVKKAIAESMKKKYKQEWFPETGSLYRIEVALLKDTATLTIDTSGVGLHKRGYREATGPSPLRENLAAALIRLARWDFSVPLIDPFCGSGTIPIEAALAGRNLAPGLNRSFAAEKWPQVSPALWRQARNEALEMIDRERPLHIRGTDLDARVLKAARESAARAGVNEDIHFQQGSVKEVSSSKKGGLIVCNPPYAERQGTRYEIDGLYREMGKVFKSLDTWSFYVLTSHTGFEQLFGQQASKKRKLYNGNIRVYCYQYYGSVRPPG